MVALALLGALVGGGLFMCWFALAGSPPRLDQALARLDRDGLAITSVADERRGLDDALVRFLRRCTLGELDADLAICQRNEARHAAEKLTTALGLICVVVALSFALVLVGVGLPPVTVMMLVVVAGGVGVVVPDLTLRANASARRHAFRHALSSYLDLVNVLLAGGAGMETALVAAADAGDGWVFQHLREELLRARTTRRSPWDCFRDLGDRLGVKELVELSATVQLAGEQGARVKQSLAARAAALRAHQLARLEADAQSATERMGLPTVLMFVGFVSLLGYPALHLIVGGW
jgi:Flp pilus assembly protein TadB